MHFSIWSCLKLHFLGSILGGEHSLEVNSHKSMCHHPRKETSAYCQAPESTAMQQIWSFSQNPQFCSNLHPCRRWGCPAHNSLELVVLNLDSQERKVILAASHRLCLYGHPAFPSHMFVHLWESFKWSLELQHTIPSVQISPIQAPPAAAAQWAHTDTTRLDTELPKKFMLIHCKEDFYWEPREPQYSVYDNAGDSSQEHHLGFSLVFLRNKENMTS